MKTLEKLLSTKPTRKALERECMALWAMVVKKRANYVCEYWGCRRTENLNAHHVFSRSRASTKFDIENGLCLCSYHHSLGNDSAHKSPEFLKKVLGEIEGYAPIRTEAWYQMLRLRANTPTKLDLKMEKLYLQKELDKLDKSMIK